MRVQRLKFGRGVWSHQLLLPSGLFLACAVLVTVGKAVWVPLAVVTAGAVYPGQAPPAGRGSSREVA